MAESAPTTDDNPTAEERADFVCRRLEQFIRDNRSPDGGMRFRTWQAMARTEIANAVADSELSVEKDDVLTKRLMFVAASSLVTIGFWGIAFSWGRVGYLAAATICILAGLAMFAAALEWRVRKYLKGHTRKSRAKGLGRIEGLNARIRQMERELKKEEQTLEKAIETARQGSRETLGLSDP